MDGREGNGSGRTCIVRGRVEIFDPHKKIRPDLDNGKFMIITHAAKGAPRHLMFPTTQKHQAMLGDFKQLIIITRQKLINTGRGEAYHTASPSQGRVVFAA